MKIERFDEAAVLPGVVRASDHPGTLLELLADDAQDVQAALLTHGALLFRGFGVDGVDAFGRIVDAISTERMTYDYGSTPRTQLGGDLYTATEYPNTLEIPLHNECAYQSVWPQMLVFCCVQAAATGGCTPLADMEVVQSKLDPEVVSMFESRGVRYVRHYRPYIDVPWQSVFQTQSKDELSAICESNDIEATWLEDDLLRTVQNCQGVTQHPATGKPVFFNQAHLFHISSHPKDAAQALIEAFTEERLPRASYFGDGGRISDEIMNHVRESFRSSAVAFPWEEGDVLLVDNMRAAHGREPFTGERKVLASLLNPASAAAMTWRSGS